MQTEYTRLGCSTLWKGGAGTKLAQCPECRKQFFHYPEHVFHREHRYYCSYTCFRKSEHRKKIALEAEDTGASMELEAARALVSRCTEKIKVYTERVNASAKDTQERANAQELVRRWRQKLDDAREYKRVIEAKEREAKRT